MLACNLTRVAVTPTIQATSTVPLSTANTDTPLPPATDTSSPQATNTPVPTDIVHTQVPGDLPTNHLSAISDRNSSQFSAQKRATGGDNVTANLYERPFNANSMDTYFPNLDILRTELTSDATWVYVTITLAGQATSGGLNGVYGAELDLDVDGRGDVLVMAKDPGSAWSTDGVQAFMDANHDIGAAHPVSADAPANGNGYETKVFDAGVGSDADLVWVRISPTDANSVQLAFKQTLINADNKFTWNAWAMDASMFNPAWFDLNDQFTAADMGSPLVELTEFYPLKKVAEVDNTCRWSVGFTPTGTELGICPLAATPTPVLPGKISGRVFNDDTDKDGIFGTGSYPYQNIPIEVHAGTCSGDLVASTASNTEGFYSVSVPAGTYCVQVAPPRPDPGGAPPRTVVVPNGSTVPNVDFAFWSA